jgi:uncharacterized repeat protein (TIGR01451 family)
MPTSFRETLLVLFAWGATAVAQSPLVDPEVIPAQRLGVPFPPPSAVPDSPSRIPSGVTVPTGVTSTPGRGSAPVVDPPSPQVQLSLRTPSHIPPGKPVPYKITVTNTSQSKALRLKVRMPWPEGAAQLNKCEPKADNVKELASPREVFWTLPSLNRGESKTFELEFLPAATVKQVTATAYVSFEYGAKVDTAIDVPKVSVKKTATPQVAVGELATVRVEVTNTGKVTVPGTQLLEQVRADVELRGDTDAEKTKEAGQRIWKLGDLAPGQTKIVTYQLVAKNGGEVLTSSNALTGEGQSAATADATIKVQVPSLSLQFTGPETGTSRSRAEYTAVVRNTGTMPMENVRLAVQVPEDLNVVKLTNGCRTDRTSRVWMIPRMAAGESQAFRVTVEPEQGVSGRRTLKASVSDSRGKVNDQTQEITTSFIGRADLTWKPSFDKARIAVGSQGTITVVVKNQGSETDKGVRLRMTLPSEVQPVDTGPVKANLEGNTLLFPPQALGPGKTIEFTLTYQGRSAGSAGFTLLLESESLGDKPLKKDQVIEVGR